MPEVFSLAGRKLCGNGVQTFGAAADETAASVRMAVIVNVFHEYSGCDGGTVCWSGAPLTLVWRGMEWNLRSVHRGNDISTMRWRHTEALRSRHQHTRTIAASGNNLS